MGSVIRNAFLEYRTKQINIFVRLSVLYASFATNKAIYSVGIFSVPVVTHFIVKFKENHKNTQF